MDFIKNIKNYHGQELIRFIFQYPDNLSHIKWYISIILTVIKPVDFHHFGKEYKCKSGGRGGGWGGGSSERCLKRDGGGGWSLRDLSKSILKRGG